MGEAAVRHDAPAVGKSRPLLTLLGDDRLFDLVSRGSHRAFEALYERHHRGILAFCRHMLGTAHDAEEAVQQTFTAAYADLTGGERPDAPKPWLYGVARHRCLAILRRRRVDAGPTNPGEPTTAPLVEEVERRTEVRDLLSGVSRLPEPQRTALVLFGLCGHAQSDVAAVLGCDEARVRALVYQARTSLAEDRRARETPCHEVREKLALGHGGALRRRALRRHVKFCPGCAEFRAEVLRQRRLLGAIPTVDASMALKAQVLAAVGLAGTTTGGGGTPIGVGGSLALAKIVTAALVLTATPVGGGILLHERRPAPTAVGLSPPPRATAPHHRSYAGEATVAGESTPAPTADSRTAGPAPTPSHVPDAKPPRRPAAVAPGALVPPSPVEPGLGFNWPWRPAEAGERRQDDGQPSDDEGARGQQHGKAWQQAPGAQPKPGGGDGDQGGPSQRGDNGPSQSQSAQSGQRAGARDHGGRDRSGPPETAGPPAPGGGSAGGNQGAAADGGGQPLPVTLPAAAPDPCGDSCPKPPDQRLDGGDRQGGQ